MKLYNVSSRSARQKLKPRPAPYYSRVRVGRSLGYRRVPGSQIGRWYLRYKDQHGDYVVSSICQADDLPTGQNGPGTMTFEEGFSYVQRFDPVAAKAKPKTLATVAEVLDYYMASWVIPNSKNPDNLQSIFDNHIRPKLGGTPVVDLRPSTMAELLIQWAAQPRLDGHGKPGRVPTSEDERRSSRSTANRWYSALLASLRRAYNNDLLDPDVDPRHWKTPRLRHTHRAGRRGRRKWLSVEEMRELLRVTHPDTDFYCKDFHNLLKAAIFTGRRFGDLCKMRVLDFDPKAETISFSETKTDSDETAYLTPEAVQWFLEITSDLGPDDQILSHCKHSRGGRRVGEDGKPIRQPWSVGDATYPMSLASKLANISGGGANFYAIRHSYAVAWLNNGGRRDVLREQLGHKDDQMLTRNYGHIGDHQRRIQAHEHAPVLDMGTADNVTSISKGRKAS